MKNYYNYF